MREVAAVTVMPMCALPPVERPATVLAPPPAEDVELLDSPPTFSVVVAAYQVADVIGEALESAFA